MRGGKMIILSDYEIFTECYSTLQEASLDRTADGTEIFMTDCATQVVNFDQVKEKYIVPLKLSETPASNDALFENGKGNIIFVEFKNGYIDKKTQFRLRKKIYDSMLIFTDIVSAGIRDMREVAEYILVYNEIVNADNNQIQKRRDYVQPSDSFVSIAKRLGGLAKNEYVSFGLKMFENYCFKKVHTYTEKEFEQYLTEIFSKKLPQS